MRNLLLSAVAAAAVLAVQSAPAQAWYDRWGYPGASYSPAGAYDIFGRPQAVYGPRPPVYVYTVPGNGYVDEECRVLTEPTAFGWRRVRVCE